MRKLIAVILLFSLLLVGCKEDVPELIKPVNSSSVYYTVSKDTISSKIVFDGKVSPETEVLYAGASGTAYEVNFKPGDSVTEGDVLFSLNEGIEDEIAELEAELSQFETISNLYIKLNENEITRMKNILAGKSGMDKDLYQLEIELKEYEHSVSESERAAELEEKQAYYDELLIKQAYSKVTAPTSGIIVSMGVFAEGDSLEENSVACVIAKEDVKYFQFDGVNQSVLDSADTITLQIGSMSIDNPEFITFTEEETLDNSFKTESVYVAVGDEFAGSAVLGQYCALTITYDTTENVISVPNECVYSSSSDGTSYCLVLNENKKEDRITVETGIVTDYYTEIISGLSEGQLVYYGTDATNWSSEFESSEVKLGSYVHTTNFGSASKSAQISESFTVGCQGKINQIFLTQSSNIQVVEGQELFTVIGSVDESVYEQAKLDYENAADSYDSSIEAYDAMIEAKQEIMDSNSKDSVEYIIAEYELNQLNADREDYVAELDENLLKLADRLAIYESAMNNEEITITAPISGTLDMILTLVTNAEVDFNTVYGTISQPDSYVAGVYDFVSDIENSFTDFGDSITISSKNPETGETLLVSGTVISADNVVPQFGYNSTIKLSDAADSCNIFESTATAFFTDKEISNVCVIGVDYLGYEGTGETKKAYVKLQTENGIIKRYVDIETPSDATSNIWVKNGLEAGDIIVK